jgi:ATP-binding cassette subfamily B protein
VSSVTISGGQAQLLSLTRCLLRDVELYVFDDCFFSMDGATREKAIRSVFEFCSGKTVLFASHEMITVGVSDEVMLIVGGKVAERGTHEELLSNSQVYARMYGKRSGVTPCRRGCSGTKCRISSPTIPRYRHPRCAYTPSWR